MVTPTQGRCDGMLTDYTVDLDQELLYGLVRRRPSPVDCSLVDAYPSKHHIRGVWDIDTEDANELGYGCPKRLESSSHEPVRDQVSANREVGREHGMRDSCRVMGIEQKAAYQPTAKPKTIILARCSQKRSMSV